MSPPPFVKIQSVTFFVVESRGVEKLFNILYLLFFFFNVFCVWRIIVSMAGASRHPKVSKSLTLYVG